MTVALLGRDDGARASLRRALHDLGAQVVFEGDPATLQAEQVLTAAPQVVIVNLASGVEDDIDHLQPLFDHPRVNVLFNEAEVSSQLEGWDLARWARHLASKVLGHERTIPPPPPGAELLPMRNLMPVPGAPPTPAQQAIERPIEEFMIEAEDRVDDVPSSHLPLADVRPPWPLEESPAELRIDASGIEGALTDIDVAPTVELRAVPEPEVSGIVVHEDEAAEFDAGLDLAALDAALQLEQAPRAAPAKSDAALLDEALSGLDLSLDPEFVDGTGAGDETLEPVLGAPPRGPVSAPRDAVSRGDDDAGLAGLDLELESLSMSTDESIDFDAGEDSLSIGSVSLSDDGVGLADRDGFLDDDVAALAAQLDAFDASPARGEVKDLDFIDVSDAPVARTAPEAPAVAPVKPAATVRAEAPPPPAPPAAAKLSFGDLDLTPMDDEPAAPAPVAAKPASAYDFSNLNFSLEPTEEELEEVARAAAATPAQPTPTSPPVPPRAVTPAPDPAPAAAVSSGSDLDALFAAMDLAPARAAAAPAPSVASGGIRRVIVLGASIGGPDALRTFLGAIPEGFPALFLLAQHLENAFFERLAQQLQKSSKLPVRVPDPARRAEHGEVLVVPAGQRVQVTPDGDIALHGYPSTPKYTPCIDDVLRDIADQYGANATAIIFSGMAGDAIEGSVYLTSLGGEVWAQDPASCVVSSMVDGARARGVVEFVGSPRELAEHCVMKYGRG